MSSLSKVVLATAGAFAVGIILVVHMSQDADRKRLREGVWRDLERQEKKRKNQDNLENQLELKRILKKERKI